MKVIDTEPIVIKPEYFNQQRLSKKRETNGIEFKRELTYDLDIEKVAIA